MPDPKLLRCSMISSAYEYPSPSHVVGSPAGAGAVGINFAFGPRLAVPVTSAPKIAAGLVMRNVVDAPARESSGGPPKAAEPSPITTKSNSASRAHGRPGLLRLRVAPLEWHYPNLNVLIFSVARSRLSRS